MPEKTNSSLLNPNQNMNDRDQWFRQADAICRSYIMRTLTRKWKNRPQDDVEDAYQEALISLARSQAKGARFAGPKPLRSWMYKATCNILRSMHRSDRIGNMSNSMDAQPWLEGQDEEATQWDMFGEHEEKVLFERRSNWLTEQLALLSAKQGGMITGFHLEGKCMDELAVLHGYSDRNSAKVAKRKALALLEELARESGLYMDKAA
jgi:RNA polymerase sigma factor (sigma-70 family)